MVKLHGQSGVAFGVVVRVPAVSGLWLGARVARGPAVIGRRRLRRLETGGVTTNPN